MQPNAAPNANFYQGMGPAYGQAGFVAGQPVMPNRISYFEGVRWFESTNLPETLVQPCLLPMKAAAPLIMTPLS